MKLDEEIRGMANLARTYDAREAYEQHRDFIEVIKPLIAHKAYVAGLCVPSMTIYPDGHMERGEYPEWVKEQFRIVDEVIDQIASAIKKDGDTLRRGENS